MRYNQFNKSEFVMEWGRMMEECQNEWGELSQVIEKHINFMMERYLETGKVSRSIVTRIGFFPYAECLRKVLKDKDWNRLNNLIYQENCFRSLCALTSRDTHYWAFLDMLDALAVGNMKTLDLLVPPPQNRTGNTYLSYIQTCHQYAD